jgi:1-acyl-sn-glycerol-3-phosphate acyltransferase
MSLIKIVLYPIIVLIGALALFAFININRIFKKYRTYGEVKKDPEWEGLIRKDFNRWDKRSIRLGCLLRFPFKFLVLLSFLIGDALTILAVQANERIGLKIQGWFVRYFGRFTLYSIMDLNEVTNFDSVKTPIVISNHVNWMDPVYLGARLYPLSFVAKEAVSRVPVIGPIARYLQCLFLSRKSEDARKEMLEKINERVRQYSEQPNVNPLLIFPEGTTGNGRSILRFKIGAFASLPKITIFGFVYDCKGFDMGMDEVTPIEHIIISLSLKVKLTVKRAEMEPLPNEEPQAYMRRCQ